MIKYKNNYVIVCDESTKNGKNYSYFYGGAILKEEKYQFYSEILEDYKNKLGLNELKRTKITKLNYKNYIKVLDLFFTFVKSGNIKIRIMFSPNNQLLTDIRHCENESFMKFYYAFIINAFNIFYANINFNLRLICDDLPETKKKCDFFKEKLIDKIIHNSKPLANKVYIDNESIQEVDSKKHVILQCVDVIVGLVDFVLNTTKKELSESIRAQSKLEVWKSLYNHIKEIDENFIINESTNSFYSKKAWKQPYKHFIYHQKKKSPNISTNRPRESVALRKY